MDSGLSRSTDDGGAIVSNVFLFEPAFEMKKVSQLKFKYRFKKFTDSRFKKVSQIIVGGCGASYFKDLRPSPYKLVTGGKPHSAN